MDTKISILSFFYGIGQDSSVCIAKQPGDASEERLLKINGAQLSSFLPN
jgi:hypothetical protein